MYDWQGAIRQLAAEIERQKKQIRQLEEEKDKIWKEIERIRSRPPLHVEKIDYHFDQLKVERLEGTLNIGINPGQLQDMDEFYPGISPDPLPPEKKNNWGKICVGKWKKWRMPKSQNWWKRPGRKGNCPPMKVF
jgi:Spore germination protein GerPC.